VLKPWRAEARSANRHTAVRRRSSALTGSAPPREDRCRAESTNESRPGASRPGSSQRVRAGGNGAGSGTGVVHSPRRDERTSEKSWCRTRLDRRRSGPDTTRVHDDCRGCAKTGS
jgi:hypothetical protein